jgi:phosphoribosylaminoimidazolecarboxamide formyltransferase/IMP cyclohydrolase
VRALVSVSDKAGLDILGKFLTDNNIEIVSSGGTRKHLETLGFSVTAIESVTGNPEAFGGRMKTLSFQVSSGILFRRDHEEDIKQANELNIKPIDIVVCNLYPFKYVKEKGGDWDELVENVDIGGPTMVRAAAKNYKSVWTLTSPSQYQNFIEDFTKNSIDTRKKLSMDAFIHTASYDSLIAQTFEEEVLGNTNIVHIDLNEAKEVRYGENPHQKGWVVGNGSLASAVSLQGKELSYNNYLDADAAWRHNLDLSKMTKDFAVTIIKHSNPCGVAVSKSGLNALEKAWSGDPISAFGSIISFNKEVNKEMATFVSERFVEVVMAPSFSSDASEVFSKRKNLRVIELPLEYHDKNELMVRSINGGHIVQREDHGEEESINIVTKSSQDIDLSLVKFGINICKHLKSNAICLVFKDGEDYVLAGAGMGNPNRLVSIEQAIAKSKSNGHTNFGEMCLVSDAFFPFRDNIDLTNSFGIKTIIQPGGSIKDNEVIEACNEFKMNMFFTGMRHFRH